MIAESRTSPASDQVRYLAEAVPRKTSITNSCPFLTRPRSCPIHNSTRKANGPLRVLLQSAVDRYALCRDVERLVHEAHDLRRSECVCERRDVRQWRLAKWGSAVREVDDERRCGLGVAAEERGTLCQIVRREDVGGLGDRREGVCTGEERGACLSGLRGALDIYYPGQGQRNRYVR